MSKTVLETVTELMGYRVSDEGKHFAYTGYRFCTGSVVSDNQLSVPYSKLQVTD